MSFDYKNLTDNELAEIFKDHKFRIWPKRGVLISLAFAIGENLDSVAYWLPVRFGKTITALLTAKLWDCKKILVVCPNSAFEAWNRDVTKATDYTYEFLVGTRSERIYKLRHTDKNVYVINYEGLKSIYGYLYPGDGINKGEWHVYDVSFVDNFDCVIFDEIHKVTDYGAIQSDICYELSKRAKHCIGLSADPISKHYLELFNIYKAIDLGETFGNNFFAFRNIYFRSIDLTNGKTGRSFKKWVLKHGAEELILKKISKRSISFGRSECSTVPDNEPIVVNVEPSDEFLNWQKKIIENDEVLINGVPVDVSDLTTKGTKILQLSAGFIYSDIDGLHNDNLGIHNTQILKTNPKLDALIDLIDVCQGKVVVWHKYSYEADMIEKALTDHDIEFEAMNGSIKEPKESIMKRFNTKPEIKVLLVQQTINEGWDGKIAKYMIFYQPVAGPRIRNQCEGRMKGDGQVDDYCIYDLIMKDSFDEVVNRNLKKNKTFKKSVMDYIQGLNK